MNATKEPKLIDDDFQKSKQRVAELINAIKAAVTDRNTKFNEAFSALASVMANLSMAYRELPHNEEEYIATADRVLSAVFPPESGIGFHMG